MAELGGSVDRERIMRMLGLDLPVHVQYGRWIGGVLQGDLGVSLRGSVPITPKILARLPVTFELGLLGIIIGLSISLPIGIYSAIRQNTVGDYAGRGVAVTFISVPTFWTATMVMIYPALWWGWSPSVRLIRFAQDPLGNLGMFLVPAAILGMVLSGTTMRMTRTMALEVLRQDYVRTAWSKGLEGEGRGDAACLEECPHSGGDNRRLSAAHPDRRFGHPGADLCPARYRHAPAGRHSKAGLPHRPSGINLIIATAVVLINLLIDLSYAFLDPRVRYR